MAGAALRLRRIRQCGVVMAVGLCVALLVPSAASAVVIKLTERRIVLGTPRPAAVTDHSYHFVFSNPAPANSIAFEYCTSPLQDLACEAPAGVDVSNAELHAQSGVTGFGIDHSLGSSNRIVISRAPSADASGVAEYEFTDVTNPSQRGTFYVRIIAYASQDASGPNDAYGAVANATVQSVNINSEVPPILNFCVAVYIPRNCASARENLIELGNLSSAVASSGTSQMLTSTNANFGLVITMLGQTMSSGADALRPLAKPTASAPGTSQFGVNLRANRDPAVGKNATGPGVAQPTANYNQPNKFMFHSGDIVANTTGTTNTRTFTVSYVVNVPPDQPSGVYNTTLTYVCTATF